MEGIEDHSQAETLSNMDQKLEKSTESPRVAVEAGSQSPKIPEKLEVPSNELQIIRKQVLIEKLMKTSRGEHMLVDISTSGTYQMDTNCSEKKRQSLPSTSRKQEDFQHTFKMKSSVLDRVKTFLPELRNANEKLTRVPVSPQITLEPLTDIGESCDTETGSSNKINSISQDTSCSTEGSNKNTYVEMNLALLEQSDSETSDDENDFSSSSSFKTCKVKELSLSLPLPETVGKAISVDCAPGQSNISSESLKVSQTLPLDDENVIFGSQDNRPGSSN